MKIKVSLVGVLAYLAFLYNIQRLDFGQQAVDIHGIVNVIVFIQLISQVLIRRTAKISLGVQIAFWLGVFFIGRLVWAAFFSQALFGGIHTYIFVTEAALVTLGVILGHRVARDFSDFEEAVEQLSLGEAARKARKIEEVNEDIQLELSRSRRHQYPLSVIVVQSDPTSVTEVIHRTVQEVQRAMMGRYMLAGLGRLLSRHLRRTDILVDQMEKGRFVIVSPDTDAAHAQQLIERLQPVVTGRIGIQVTCGVATFPETALTFEELVHVAEADLKQPAALVDEFGAPLDEVTRP